MTKITSLQAVAGALLACCLSAAPAAALANRTWVSGIGTDSGGCTRAAPCKTFAFALTQTAAGGEIDVLDPADLGTVTITKSISIVNDGVGVAGILAGAGFTAITVNAGASDSVHLRGLTIEGLTSGNSGIEFINGGNLAIENCVIRNFYRGIYIRGTGSISFSVSNTIASNNDFGINIFVTTPIKGVLSNVIMNNNGYAGIDLYSFEALTNVTIADSVSSSNKIGIRLFVATRVTVMVRNSTVANNETGIAALDGALYLARSTVTGNSTGVIASGGTIFSYGDNDIHANTNNNWGDLTPLAMH